MLFVDTFSRYFDVDVARAAVRVLQAAGYRVQFADRAGLPICCGRTYLAAGLVDQAKAEARRTIDALAPSPSAALRSSAWNPAAC